MKSLRQRVINIFLKFGGWWRVEGMAEWLHADVGLVKRIYDQLESEGLMERKKG